MTEEQIELMTDLQISRLATLHLACREGFLDDDPLRPYREEIRTVIRDTVFLMESDDPAATLERWAETP